MEYDFLRTLTGEVQVKMSMGHEVIGHWFNEEVKGRLAFVQNVAAAAVALKGSGRQWQHNGHEYSLRMAEDEVIICANSLSIQQDMPQEGLNYYNDESQAICGTEDFLVLLSAYCQFLEH